jgi:hypothetical protein
MKYSYRMGALLSKTNGLFCPGIVAVLASFGGLYVVVQAAG